MRPPLKILHAPTNIAGIAGLLARAQRDLGYAATATEYVSPRFAFGVDTRLHLEAPGGKLRKGLRLAGYATRAVARFDVYHFYFGNTLLPWPFPDLPVLRALGKRIIYHYCGCDIRNRTRTLAEQSLSGCQECVIQACRQRRRPPQRYADTLFVSTPDLLADVPGAVLVPGPIDLGRWRPLPARTTPPTASDPLRILHAPTDREIKGTRYVLAAIERLKAAGYPVELVVLEGVPYAEVPGFAGRADVIVDQLMIGAYGTFAVEGMAVGRPVVCRIRDDLRRHYPADLPISSADPDTVYAVLERLVVDGEARAGLGRAGPAYAARVHDMHRVAELVLPYYTAPAPAPVQGLPAA